MPMVSPFRFLVCVYLLVSTVFIVHGKAEKAIMGIIRRVGHGEVGKGNKNGREVPKLQGCYKSSLTMMMEKCSRSVRRRRLP